MASPNAWISLLTYWFFDRFGVSPLEVFSSPFDFDPSCLPPFYCSLLLAWRKSGDCFSNPLNSLAVGHCTVESLTCKFVYQQIVFLNPCSPHCVDKFRPTFGVLYWPSTWMQLSLWIVKLLILVGRSLMGFSILLSGFLLLAIIFLLRAFLGSIWNLWIICSSFVL